MGFISLSGFTKFCSVTCGKWKGEDRDGTDRQRDSLTREMTETERQREIVLSVGFSSQSSLAHPQTSPWLEARPVRRRTCLLLARTAQGLLGSSVQEGLRGGAGFCGHTVGPGQALPPQLGTPELPHTSCTVGENLPALCLGFLFASPDPYLIAF